MTKLKLIFVSIFLSLMISGCTKDGAPMSFFLNIDKNSMFNDNNVKPKVSGSACTYSVWPWATVGDSSTNSAKDNAGISKISTIDKSHFSVFTWSPAGWFIRNCSVVTGE